ncbi:MAG: cytochrome P450 [Marinibacterium sp.]|nr:cytochrome P450 [Marinibacterium sp.]
MTALPPKPGGRAGRVSLWRYARMFRRDILSAQPDHLFHAWMAEFRTPFFRSFLVNQPDLVGQILSGDMAAFPKSERVGAGLAPLLGRSVFLSNGEDWARQRRLIDPAFAQSGLRASLPAMQAAAEALVQRLASKTNPIEIEAEASHAAADVIFRTLFSVPIEDATATEVFAAFRAFQRAQPVLSPAAFLPALRRWQGHVPGPARRHARRIRARILDLCDQRRAQIAAGTAPDDLATRLMTARDPETGAGFDRDEMIDQVAIFFLAGHETSASALAWALYLLATHRDWQARAAAEAQAAGGDPSRLRICRDVFRETLRLYPPVPMMVRENRCARRFRGRDIPVGAQLVISPWHLHRHDRIWRDPDAFDPGRWRRDPPRAAYAPFSKGKRVCPGAGFAMAEGVVLIARILQQFDIHALPDRVPVPVAHLTLRARDGIWLRVTPRAAQLPEAASEPASRTEASTAA